MISVLRNLFHKLGIDKPIVFSVLNRVVQAAGNLLVIVFISRFLTKPEQGYYYTFGSIAAMQVFFELGLSVVITQFVAHELAFVQLNENKFLVEGDQKHIARLASLLRFIVKWYSWGALIFLLIVAPSGYLFFHLNEGPTYEFVSWVGPWLLLALGTALNLGLSAYLPIVDGFNKVTEAAKIRMVQSALSLSVLCLSLFAGVGLWGLGLFAITNFVVLVFAIVSNQFVSLLKTIWVNFDSSVTIDWKDEIFPFQWRIAMSWLSGFFIFQMFNPIIFAFDGAIAAGQAGITLAAFSGLSVVAMAWVNTKIPTFSMLIAQRKYEELDKIFFRSMRQSFVLIVFAVAVFLSILAVLQSQHTSILSDFGSRFLPLKWAVFIGLSTITNQLIFSMAAYLRSHKKEPLLINSIVGALITFVVTYITAKWWGVGGIMIANFMSTFLIGLTWVSYIFYTKRISWHKTIDESEQ